MIRRSYTKSYVRQVWLKARMHFDECNNGDHDDHDGIYKETEHRIDESGK